MSHVALPKMIALQTRQGHHIGFALFAISDGQNRGDCVFMILPPNTALWDTPDVLALFSRKEFGESKVHVESTSPLHLRIHSGDLPPLTIQLSDAGTGECSEALPGTAAGRAISPPTA